jgi:hypothetical protein
MPEVDHVSSHDLLAFKRVRNDVKTNAIVYVQASPALDLRDVTENALVGIVSFDEHEAFGAIANNYSSHGTAPLRFSFLATSTVLACEWPGSCLKFVSVLDARTER